MLMDASSLADHSIGHWPCGAMHQWFCFAGDRHHVKGYLHTTCHRAFVVRWKT